MKLWLLFVGILYCNISHYIECNFCFSPIKTDGSRRRSRTSWGFTEYILTSGKGKMPTSGMTPPVIKGQNFDPKQLNFLLRQKHLCLVQERSWGKLSWTELPQFAAVVSIRRRQAPMVLDVIPQHHSTPQQKWRERTSLLVTMYQRWMPFAPMPPQPSK